ncbi:MAG: NADH-quinone oxidoreductase subunit C [Verrucomicrobiales bacterium]|nr:NADH-quinone oxidoreductase subunit C [Verrucomicrobiales bacterium]
MSAVLDSLEAAFREGLPAARCERPDPGVHGGHLEVQVAPGEVVGATQILDRHGFAIDAITGWTDRHGRLEGLCDFFHFTAWEHVAVRTRVPRDLPELPSIAGVYAGANWHERETHEFFGIRFRGHPNLTPLLLPEDATYHPLRKDFSGVA